MALDEKTKIWIAIKAALPLLNVGGVNSVELLLWSQDKDLGEVRRRLGEIREEVEEKEKSKNMEREEIESGEEEIEVEGFHKEIDLNLS